MDIDKLNSLLHYMKGAEPFSKTFQQLTMNTKKWCPFTHGDKIDNDCYVSNPAVNGLDEAIVCFQNYCFIATIIMAVSAVESRINELIRTKDNKLHTAYFKKATLGQLIQVFDDKQYTDTKFPKNKKINAGKTQAINYVVKSI